MKTSRFYFKVYVKNIVFLLMVIAVSFFCYYHKEVLEMSISLFTRLSSYSLYCTTIGMMIISTYIGGNKYEIIETIVPNKNKLFLSNILAGIKVSTLLFAIPCIIIFSHINYIGVNVYTIREFFNYAIIWYCANIFAVVLGGTVGVFIDKFYRYIICIIIYLFLIGSSMRLLYLPSKFSTIFSGFLSIFTDKVTAPVNYASPILFNRIYLLDKLFIIFNILFMITLVYVKTNIKTNKNKYRYYTGALVVFLIIQSSMIYMTYPLLNIANDPISEVENKNIQHAGYSIKGYSMNIDVFNKLNNKCSINLTTNNLEKNQLEFFLSEIFKVDKVFINGNKAKYSRVNDKIIIETNNIEDSELIVDIEYSGKVYVESFNRAHVLYTSNRDISLLDNIIYWYPTLDNNQKSSNFQIDVKSKSKIYSNLPKIKEDKNESYYYTRLKGEGSGLNILSGNYTTMNYENLEIVYPKCISESNIKIWVDEHLNQDFYPTLDISRINKIIISSGGNGIVIDETIFMPIY
ncbi:hypothetical protein [Anaerosalibacter massiliensis]|uniref:hypothetical protein n=1 Tax=Anaerosalibacter massiliensis TaxID=1347392 RepID=UPI0005B2AED1|nr:hypothetical protein [Anaerosalibacter massiliensis]